MTTRSIVAYHRVTSEPPRAFLLSRLRGGRSQFKEDFMAQKESRLSRAIMEALKREYGRDIFCFKIHGGPFMMAGLPDIVGFVYGRAFGLETKIPDHGNVASERQQYVHTLMRRAGAIVDTPRSVAEALAIVARCVPLDIPDRRLTAQLRASASERSRQPKSPTPRGRRA